ncbi:hypothetical protein [Ruminobacter amylophilus]|uniref:hypothetical protein n=1 Tax=Ruminobacter amylophilus TaxID=867 RepID=UPI003867A3D8
MKKFIAACALLLSSVAFAGIPAGYQEVESGADNQRVFVNGETGAAFSIMVQANEEGATAKDIAAAGAQELGCKGEVEGDETFAGASACDVNGQTLDYAVIVGDGKMVVFYANDKVTKDEVTAFTTWILSDEE